MSDINNKIAIFGGSFDPIHNAHISIVKELVKRFDKVIVVPSYESPFKIGVKKASAEDRLNMLKAALKDISRVEISDYEISKKGISYSVDTAKHYLSSGKLYWIIGSEMLKGLPYWKQIDEIKDNVIFYVVPRPGFDIVESKELKDFNIEIADFSGENVSSSLIKIDIAFGKRPKLPDSVYTYILAHGLYDDYKFIVDRYNSFHLTEFRKIHLYNVTLTAIELAKIYDADINKTIIAALLHDIAKSVDKIFEMKLDISCNEPIKECRHAELGTVIAEKYFGITDIEILNAIKYHTVSNKNMGKIAKIIALADYIEPGRNFDGLDKIREMSKIDLDKSVIMMLESTMSYLKRQQREIHKNSIEALNYFKQKEAEK